MIGNDRIYKNVLRIQHERQESAGISEYAEYIKNRLR